MSLYTLGTRSYSVGPLSKRVKKTVQTVEYEGKFLRDIQPDEDPQAVLSAYQEQERKALEYRAQFATEEEWIRHLDEGSGG